MAERQASRDRPVRGATGEDVRNVVLSGPVIQVLGRLLPNTRSYVEKILRSLAWVPDAGVPMLAPLHSARILTVSLGIKVVYLASTSTVTVASLHVPRDLVLDDGGRCDRFGALLLAAGRERCCGRPLQLYPVDGKPCIMAALEPYLVQGLHDVVLVVGDQASAVRRLIAGRSGGRDRLTLAYAGDVGGPMSRSLQKGIRVADPGLQALFLALGTQPRVSPATLAAMIAAFQRHRPLAVRPCHRSQPGHPVLFATSLLDEFATLSRRETARAIFERHSSDVLDLPVDDPGVVTDVRELLPSSCRGGGSSKK